MSYNRAPAPAPLTIGESGGASGRRPNSFESDTSEHENLKEIHRSPSHGTGEHRNGSKRRTSSMSSAKPASPTVNLYTHCGRHSDQFLFGGWSDLLRSTFKKE